MEITECAARSCYPFGGSERFLGVRELDSPAACSTEAPDNWDVR